jgi:hypothetical protein
MHAIVAALPWLVPAATGAAAIGTQAWQGGVQSRRADTANEQAQQAQQRALQQYQAISKPAPEVVGAQAAQNRGALGQARLGAYQNLAGNLAKRGFYSNSGIGIEGASNIEKGYLQGLAQQHAETTKFANTPQFAPPGAAWPQGPQFSVPGGLEASLGSAGNMMNTALGMYMANQALYNKGIFGGGTETRGQKAASSIINWPGYGNQSQYFIGGP